MKAQRKTPRYGRVRSPAEVGELCRRERVQQDLTLSDMYETTGLSTRFLSEFERGREHVSLARALRALESLGLDVLILPRREAQQMLRSRLAARDDQR